MSQTTKTYSAQQSFHEMLIRAQALSPVLTFLLCNLLLKTKVDPQIRIQSSANIHLCREDRWEQRARTFGVYFDLQPESSKMSKFIKEVFGGFTVSIGWGDSQGHHQHLMADTPFVQWLQSGVVTVDDEKQLVTINL